MNKKKPSKEDFLKFCEEIKLSSDGIVVFDLDMVAFAWMREIRNPSGYLPDCIAMDKDGNTWIAVGGDDYNGANEWVLQRS